MCLVVVVEVMEDEEMDGDWVEILFSNHSEVEFKLVKGQHIDISIHVSQVNLICKI